MQFSGGFVVEFLRILILIITRDFFFPYWSELFLSWAFLLRDMLFKGQLEKEFIQGNAPRSQEKGVRRRNLTNTHVRSDLVFDLSTWGRWIRYPGSRISLSYFPVWHPSAHITNFPPKSENHLFIHSLCLPLLPPPVKHLSNAKPSPTPALPTREKKWKKRILGHRELAETGDKQFDEVKGQSSGSDECVTLTLSPEVQIRKEILRMLSTLVLFFFPLNNLYNSFT